MPKHRSTDLHRDDTGDDAGAFRAAVRDVKPLPQTPLPEGMARTPPRAQRGGARRDNARRGSARRGESADALDVDEAMPLIDPAGAAVEAVAARGVQTNGVPMPGAAASGGDALSFQRPGVQTGVVRRLRRGSFPIEDELDLHGLTQRVAREQLAHFLAVNRAAGRRCVRVIHGKGYRSGARGPILKMAVDLWLRRHADVMAFASARPIDGGTGAVYVLLRA